MYRKKCLVIAAVSQLLTWNSSIATGIYPSDAWRMRKIIALRSVCQWQSKILVLSKYYLTEGDGYWSWRHVAQPHLKYLQSATIYGGIEWWVLCAANCSNKKKTHQGNETMVDHCFRGVNTFICKANMWCGQGLCYCLDTPLCWQYYYII